MATTRNWLGTLALVLGALVLLASAAALAESDRGEKLYVLCTQCHGANGQGSPLALAPAIAGLDLWYVEAQLAKFRGGVRGGHPDDIAGMRMKPMSRVLRTEQDVKDVAVYVASLPKVDPEPVLTGGDPAKGKTLYATCGACHGVNGEGVKALNGPALTNINDWYLLTQLSNFKAGVRGGNPVKDPTGGLMRGMALQLDEQGMKDVIAYVETLQAAK